MTDTIRETSTKRELVNLPSWLRPTIGRASQISRVQRIIKQRGIHTICEEGRCPNRAECYSQGVATFLLMGDICTRNCGFCQVAKGKPPRILDENEPAKIAEAVSLLGLKYVVLTSVARDDLPDGGAFWFVKVMEAIREKNPDTLIEVLTPDFARGKNWQQQQRESIAKIVRAHPACYNHNLETVARLQDIVRRGARYERSLRALAIVKELNPAIPTKSGLMLGLGETFEEIIATMEDLRRVDCNRLTLGQYLRPSLAHLPVQKYWTVAEFDQLRDIAYSLGFEHVSSGPLVRSSYHASLSVER